jgi:hypothetical protein
MIPDPGSRPRASETDWRTAAPGWRGVGGRIMRPILKRWMSGDEQLGTGADQEQNHLRVTSLDP